ncbi:MAG: hypothetical protein IJ950_02445 [Helicobacter sp.]|nr:hypothetical protein [Helicobacter sp.]
MRISNNLLGAIISCAFFALFSWIAILLISSRFFDTFSYIFFVFIRDQGLFSFLTNAILFCGALIALGFLIVASWYKKLDVWLYAFALGMCVGCVYIVAFCASTEIKPQELTDLLLIESSIDHRSMIESLWDYKLRIILSLIVYVFFIFMPLIFAILHLVPNTKTYTGWLLDITQPSFNTMVIALFACAFQPFYFKQNAYDYIDLALFAAGIILFFVVLVRQKHTLNFYGYSNLAILIFGVVLVAFCSNILASSDQYFSVRYTLYAFVFIVWCVECMYNYITYDEE